MPPLATVSPALQGLIQDNDGVLDLGTALKHMSPDAIRWRVRSGRWQRPCHQILVAQDAPLTDAQKQRVSVLWGGPDAALAGLTAARLAGLTGFDRDTEMVHLLRMCGRKTRSDKPPSDVIVHYSRRLGPAAVSPNLVPRRTRIARSLIDAAEWMPTDRGAQAILAAGVQQGLTRVNDLRLEVDRGGPRRRRPLMWTTLRDIEGGSQALSELDFLRLVVRGFGLPDPDRQVARRDDDGKKRYLDVVWEWARVAVEIDGAGHVDMLQYWDDMDRDNQLKLQGYTVLRFPAAAVRQCPEQVARQIRAALEAARARARLDRRLAAQQEVFLKRASSRSSFRTRRAGPPGHAGAAPHVRGHQVPADPVPDHDGHPDRVPGDRGGDVPGAPGLAPPHPRGGSDLPALHRGRVRQRRARAREHPGVRGAQDEPPLPLGTAG